MLAHNKGTPKYIKQLLMSQQNGEIYSNTLIVGTLPTHYISEYNKQIESQQGNISCK